MRRLFEGSVYLYFSSKLRCLVWAAFNGIITVCSEFEIYHRYSVGDWYLVQYKMAANVDTLVKDF